MFKSARWRSDRNRIKALFKFHFHATQVLQSGVEALALSIVPVDLGKPTTRLEKASVKDGSCKWENAVYETVKFVKDPKTGKINERIYHFLVSTGLSNKGGLFGEVSIDLADYVEALKPSSVSLPLENSHCDALLHVSIQRLQENLDQREVEERAEVKVKSLVKSLKTYIGNGDTDESTESHSSEDASAKTVELSADCTMSTQSDITLSSSESSSGIDSPQELRMRNATMHRDPSEFVSSISHMQETHKSVAHDTKILCEEGHESQWKWSTGADLGVITDDPCKDSLDALPGNRPQNSPDIDTEKLKAEIAFLSRQVDVSELELQTLRKQIVKESKRGQDLSKEIVVLKEERDAFKSECEKLKSLRKGIGDAKLRNKSSLRNGDLWTLVDEIRQELIYEKDLNANLRLQLEKTQESNDELIRALQEVEEMLAQKNREISDISIRSESSKVVSQDINRNTSKCEADNDDEEQRELEELVKEHGEAKDACLLEQKIIDLYNEIEIYGKDKDELEMQMEQLTLDYEILKQKNHDIAYKLEQNQLQEQLEIQYGCLSPGVAANYLENHIQTLEDKLKKKSEAHSDALATIEELGNHIEILENKLENQSREHSDSLAVVRKLESDIKTLEEELEKQTQSFEVDLGAITLSRVEQEQRAIRAEEALRNMRLKNANAAERLQDEFRRLSAQMISMFDANEKVTLKALAEANKVRMQKIHLEEMLQKSEEQLKSFKDDYEAKLCQLSDQVETKTYKMNQMLMEFELKSEQLEQQMKHEEEAGRKLYEVIQILEAENGRLTAHIAHLNEQAKKEEHFGADLEQMEKSIQESEVLIQRGNLERIELLSTINMVKKESETLQEELNKMRHLYDEKETRIMSLQSELERLKVQCPDMKCAAFTDEVEIEKEKCRKMVVQSKGDMNEKGETSANAEEWWKDSNGCSALSDGTKTSPKNKKSALPRNSKEIASLREKVKKLEGEIIMREAALETSTNSFLEKEKDLLCKIEELESSVEELNQSSALQRVTGDTGSSGLSDRSTAEELGNNTEHSNNNDSAFKENMNPLSSSFSTYGNLSEKETKTDMIDNKDDNLRDLLTELASVKEKNNLMGSELKEMQERYSEISVKFAEVEGERQKLVMTVRSLKNAKKSQM